MNGNWRNFSSGLGTRLRGLAAAGRNGNGTAGWPYRLPEIASLALIVAIAYVAARLTWLAVPAATGAIAAMAAGTSIAAVAPAPGGDSVAETAARVASLHLFGRAAPANAPSDKAINAPETNLNITLHGIIAASDSDESRALIVAGNGHGAGKSYRIGARIPGGAAIHGIYPDRVILDRNGRLETLKLPKSDNSGTSHVTRAPARTAPPRPPRQARARPEPRRPRPSRGPGRFSAFIRTQRAVVDGKVVGYRVYPGTNPATFIGSGLQPGDIVEAVDGRPLSSPSSLMSLMKKLKGDRPIKLKVERDGQTRQVTVSVPK